MDLRTDLQNLYALQQLDSALDAIKREFAALNPGREEKVVYDEANAVYTEAHSALKTLTTGLQDTELEQKTVEGKRKDYETKLYSGSVRAAKELQALQDEVEMLARMRGKLDEKILVLMEELESVRLKEATAKQARSVAAKALKGKQAAYEQAAEIMKGQARIIMSQREEAAKLISPELRKRYDTLRVQKGGVAVAILEDGNACGGCRLGLSSSLVRNVQSGERIEICDNCNRILCPK